MTLRQIARPLWIVAGRVAYAGARLPISLVVRNSHRTRVLIVCGEEYLLVKHWLGDNSWMLPGGGCHRAEIPLVAARRELKEELGIEPGPELFMHQGRQVCADGAFKFSYDLYVLQLVQKPQLKLQRVWTDGLAVGFEFSHVGVRARQLDMAAGYELAIGAHDLGEPVPDAARAPRQRQLGQVAALLTHAAIVDAAGLSATCAAL